MDIEVIVSLIFSSIALLISIFGVWYSRQRAKIMETQLESKKAFEQISKTILQSVRILRNNAKLEEHDVYPIGRTSSDVLSFIYDNKLKNLQFYVKPRKILISFPSDRKDYIVEDFKNVERITKLIKEEIKNIIGFHFEFDYHPDIISSSWFDVEGVLYTMRQLFGACELLKNYEDAIALFNSTVLDDLEQCLYSILNSMMKALASEHTISFSSTDKSRQITKKLLNEMVDWESINILLKEISSTICDRLLAVQKEAFSKS